MSNYGAGIRVLDVSSVPSDPTGGSVEEVAFFDIYPEDDHLPNGGIIDFVGTWSHYANFPSGYILVNTIEVRFPLHCGVPELLLTSLIARSIHR